MNYSETISLDCPYCNSKCQFIDSDFDKKKCKNDRLFHLPYMCTNCNGRVIVRFIEIGHDLSSWNFHSYYPNAQEYKPRIKLSVIQSDEIRDDFNEAINCYNNNLYNACMIMARRTVQQEMLINKVDEKLNLYEQIESTGISVQLKKLLHKIKNFGNYGAHPDFCLFDENKQIIENKKEFAKLSLEFLDRYFADTYETNLLIEAAPKSKAEMLK